MSTIRPHGPDSPIATAAELGLRPRDRFPCSKCGYTAWVAAESGEFCNVCDLRDRARDFKAERDALKAEVAEAKVRVTAMEQQLIAQSAMYEAEVERLRSIDSNLRFAIGVVREYEAAAIPHGPDLLALGAKVGDWVVAINSETMFCGVIAEFGGRHVLFESQVKAPRYGGEWFILRKGVNDATATRPAGGAAYSGPQAGGVDFTQPSVDRGSAPAVGEAPRREVAVLHDSGAAHEPNSATRPHAGVNVRRADGASVQASHEPGCASLIGKPRGACDCRESRRVDDELPEAERRDLERRRDALLFSARKLEHRVYPLALGGHIVEIIGMNNAWSDKGNGQTYHHALRAALAAHEQEASK